jgi:hypothetical protein
VQEHDEETGALGCDAQKLEAHPGDFGEFDRHCCA